MLRQLLIGGAISSCNIALHSLAMALVIRAAQIGSTQYAAHPLLRLVAIMIPVVLVLMIVHTAEVLVWALAYSIVDVVPEDVETVYFAFVNYTTLGYGDIVPAPAWRLLGPMTAMNGVLLFGWSTAVIFDVLRKAMSN